MGSLCACLPSLCHAAVVLAEVNHVEEVAEPLDDRLQWRNAAIVDHDHFEPLSRIVRSRQLLKQSSQSLWPIVSGYSDGELKLLLAHKILPGDYIQRGSTKPQMRFGSRDRRANRPKERHQ